MKKICILIPSLEPDYQLIQYVRELNTIENVNIVVVNDGSSKEYEKIFLQLERFYNCYVIHHLYNKGKGQALKTGYRFIQTHLSKCQRIICVDCDGQHSLFDIKNIIKKMDEQNNLCTMGVRQFKFFKVPLKSWIGNRLSSFLLFLICGYWLEDTQTGLRAFDYQLLDLLLEVKGDRFEYEMNALMTLINKSVDIQKVPIQTIYIDHNQNSHFRPFQDTWLILKKMCLPFFLFLLSSIFCFFIDVGLFLISLFLLQSTSMSSILISTLLARIVSLICNYQLNRKVVFQYKKNKQRFFQYLFLCMIIFLISSIGVYVLHRYLFVSLFVSKLIIDSGLFLGSYYYQKKWVFYE